MPIEHRRREPAPGVFRLSLPLPFPGLNRVNAFLLAGDEPALVDCGIYLPGAGGEENEKDDHGWADIEAGFAACDMAPGDVKRLVVTHPHIDHYGMAARFVEETGAELWMHPDAEADLTPYRDPDELANRLRDMFKDHGVSEEDVHELTAYEDWRPLISGIVEADVPAPEGESITVGERTWEFVHTPGHSRSHICLWSGEDRVLISGDHLLPTITPHIDFRRGDEDPLGDFLSSLTKVERLDPAMVLPGHGRPFEEGAERARVIQRHHDRRLGSILQVIRKEPCSADRITEEIFGTELLHFQRRLALGEALAHLVYLRRRGEIERIEGRDGKFLWKKVKRSRSLDEDD